MPTLMQIISVDKSIRYKHFLYSFPLPAFYDKIAEMEKAWGIPIGGFVRDEIYNYGLIEDRGEYRIGPLMRNKIKEFLEEHHMPLEERPIKNKGMKERQENGRAKLLAIGWKKGFDILSTYPGVVLWSRKLGVMAVAGNSWCYVYKTGHSFQMNVNFPILGYFQLAGNDIRGQFMKAINGEMQSRADALSERRRSYMIRQKKHLGYISAKRKGSPPKSSI